MYSTFEKDCEDINPTELEMKKENHSNSCASFLDIYIYIENGEFHTKLFDKQDNFDIVRMPFMSLAKCSMRASEQSS